MPYALEFAYYLTGGPVLAALAALGLWQLYLAKKSLEVSRIAIETARDDIEQRMRSERMKLAVDLCIRFSEHVLPLIEDAEAAIAKHPFPAPIAGGNRWEIGSYDQEWNGGVLAQARVQKVVKALNAMEAIAIPFKWEAADSAIARASIGSAFTTAASDYAFIVASVRAKQGVESYPAIRALCDSWCA